MEKKYTREEITNKVKTLVCDYLGTVVDEINETTNYADDLGADSVDLLEFTMGIEEEFKVSIEDETIRELNTVGKTVDYLCKVLKVEEV